MTQSGQMTTDSFARLRYAPEILRYALDDNKTLCENSEIKSVVIRYISVICVPKNINQLKTN